MSTPKRPPARSGRRYSRLETAIVLATWAAVVACWVLIVLDPGDPHHTAIWIRVADGVLVNFLLVWLGGLFLSDVDRARERRAHREQLEAEGLRPARPWGRL